MTDPSNGYEAHAAWWTAREQRSIGPARVLAWSQQLPRDASILDLGCGDGLPMATSLVAAGFHVHGVDASPSMVAAFRDRLPHSPIDCSPVESSPFFHRQFDAALAWGLLFLLPPEAQRALIARVALALHPGGSFLFTAPLASLRMERRPHHRPSLSSVATEYTRILAESGLTLIGTDVDEGENHYYLTRRTF